MQLVVRAGKGGKQGTVHLSHSLIAALEETPPNERSGYVLPCRSRQAVSERIKSLCRTARVRFKGVHALRHSAGTRLRHEQSDIVLVAEHLRQVSLETARGYAKKDNQRLRGAVVEW